MPSAILITTLPADCSFIVRRTQAPECFPPFPINVPNVQQAAESVKEILEKEAAPAPAAAAAPAPAAPAPAPAADKSTFTVTLKNPDGDQVVEYDPASDMYLLDYLDGSTPWTTLPSSHMRSRSSCSACAGKVVRQVGVGVRLRRGAEGGRLDPDPHG